MQPPLAEESTTQPMHVSAESSGREPLRVGLLVDSYLQPAWIHEVISNIQSSAIAEIELFVKISRTDSRASTGALTISELFRKRSYVFALAFLYFDRVVVKLRTAIFKSPPVVMEPRTIEPLIAPNPGVEIKPIRPGTSNEFSESDLALLRSHRLDVLLDFGTTNLQGPILSCAQYGVWRYQHGEKQEDRTAPTCVWEVLSGQSTTLAELKMLSEARPDGTVIYRSWTRTHPYSPTRNAYNCYWVSVNFILYKLRHLYELGPDGLVDLNEQDLDFPPSNPMPALPSNGQTLRALVALALRIIEKVLQVLVSFEQWYLAYQISPDPLDNPPPIYAFKKILPPKAYFWADPVPVKHEGHYYIFFEEYVYQTHKGHLSVLEVDENGVCSPPVKVLEKDDHLSYPFIFKWNGDYFMIPETNENKTVDLYRCRAFPYEWTFEKTLLMGERFTDSTLIEHESKWWMLTCVEYENVDLTNEVHLYYAESPLGPWTAHPRNPVKADIRSGRPAG